MKSLTQHIKADGSSLIPLNEKLRIGKGWVPAEDFTDFDDVKEAIVVAFDEQDKDWFVSKYEITEIDRRDNEDGTVYHIYADSNSHGEWNRLPFAWLPKYKILFHLGPGYKYVMIHPNDKERLESLYYNLFNNKDEMKKLIYADYFATVDYLLGECIGIKYYSDFYTDRGSKLDMIMTTLDISNTKKDLEEMIK